MDIKIISVGPGDDPLSECAVVGELVQPKTVACMLADKGRQYPSVD